MGNGQRAIRQVYDLEAGRLGLVRRRNISVFNDMTVGFHDTGIVLDTRVCSDGASFDKACV